MVMGALLGATVSSVALTYTGNYPVNMLLLLLLLVFLPGLMLIGSLVIRLFVKKEASGATAINRRHPTLRGKRIAARSALLARARHDLMGGPHSESQVCEKQLEGTRIYRYQPETYMIPQLPRVRRP